MLLANMSVAQLIGQAYPGNAMLRRHPAPQDRQLGELEALSEKLVMSHLITIAMLAAHVFPINRRPADTRRHNSANPVLHQQALITVSFSP